MKEPSGSGSTRFMRELLDEVVLRCQGDLKTYSNSLVSQHKTAPPFCAFNGGSDVWVDIGNKRVGVEGLRTVLQLPPSSVLHGGELDTPL